MKLKKNDIYEIKIHDLTNLGFGVGKIDNTAVFVADTVIGDVVKCKIIKVQSSFAVGKVVEIISRSENYCQDRCKNSACHSCAYKNVSIELENDIKRKNVAFELQKAGLEGVEVKPVVSSPKGLGYRNKAQYPVSIKDGKATIGFYAPKSHRVTEGADCPLAPSVFEGIIELIREFLLEHNITSYDEETGTGLVRHIYLRRGEDTGEILVTLVINGKNLPYGEKLALMLTKAFPDIVGVLLNINEKNTNVILSYDYKTIYGRSYIFDTLCGVRLKIGVSSFYQVNRSLTELLYNEVARLAEPQPTDTVLDLYCGIGSIGLTFAKRVGRLVGVEIVEEAVECAKENATINGISNAHFFTADAKNTEELLYNAEAELGGRIYPNTVILDPPRAGCDSKLLDYVASLNPVRIIYVSCNPATLARDMAYLAPLGYTAKSVTPFNMFPLTGHVESVVCLKRQIQQ